MAQRLAHAPLTQQGRFEQLGFGQLHQQQAQQNGQKEGPQRPGDQQPGLIRECSPGADQHDRVQHRRCEQKSEGRAHRCTAGQKTSGNRDVATLTGWKRKAHQGAGDRSQNRTFRQSTDPGPLGHQPTRQACDGHTHQQKWNRLKQQSLEDRPGCGEFGQVQRRVRPNHPRSLRKKKALVMRVIAIKRLVEAAARQLNRSWISKASSARGSGCVASGVVAVPLPLRCDRGQEVSGLPTSARLDGGSPQRHPLDRAVSGPPAQLGHWRSALGP